MFGICNLPGNPSEVDVLCMSNMGQCGKAAALVQFIVTLRLSWEPQVSSWTEGTSFLVLSQYLSSTPLCKSR
jgi:hypothetical protein